MRNKNQIDFLKPCPFCGSSNLDIWVDERDCCNIHCVDCDALLSTGVFESTLDELKEIWNRRVKE